MDRSHSFLIRIWDDAEEQDSDAPRWRGSIENVGSGNRLYFQDLQAILRFIEEESGIQVISRRRWPRAPRPRNNHETN